MLLYALLYYNDIYFSNESSLKSTNSSQATITDEDVVDGHCSSDLSKNENNINLPWCESEVQINSDQPRYASMVLVIRISSITFIYLFFDR